MVCCFYSSRKTFHWVQMGVQVKHKSSGSMERYKARLVAKDYTQQNGFNYVEIFLQLLNLSLLRYFSLLSFHYNGPQYNDVNNSFLHGYLYKKSIRICLMFINIRLFGLSRSVLYVSCINPFMVLNKHLGSGLTNFFMHCYCLVFNNLNMITLNSLKGLVVLLLHFLCMLMILLSLAHH